MSSTNVCTMVVLLMTLISNVHGEDSGVIIGSSIGGILALVSLQLSMNEK